MHPKNIPPLYIRLIVLPSTHVTSCLLCSAPCSIINCFLKIDQLQSVTEFCKMYNDYYGIGVAECTDKTTDSVWWIFSYPTDAENMNLLFVYNRWLSPWFCYRLLYICKDNPTHAWVVFYSNICEWLDWKTHVIDFSLYWPSSFRNM